MESHKEIPIRKFAVCTTFNEKGYHKYGKRMIQSFLANWPKQVTLYIYAEDVEVSEFAENLIVFDSHKTNQPLVEFKQQWKNVPKANGDISSIPHLAGRKDAHKQFRWDAVRFSNKVYSVFKCAQETDASVLLWMDADMYCHSPVSMQELENLCPENIDLGFLGRDRKFSECGLYYMNLQSAETKTFLKKFQEFYDNAEQGIFTLSEWHDSFVFDEARKTVKLNELNWSKGLINGEGHPLINCQWGAYLDHLKGERKTLGKSKVTDLIVKRSETYWNNK
jgi:hypothetical protein